MYRGGSEGSTNGRSHELSERSSGYPEEARDANAFTLEAKDLRDEVPGKSKADGPDHQPDGGTSNHQQKPH